MRRGVGLLVALALVACGAASPEPAPEPAPDTDGVVALLGSGRTGAGLYVEVHAPFGVLSTCGVTSESMLACGAAAIEHVGAAIRAGTAPDARWTCAAGACSAELTSCADANGALFPDRAAASGVYGSGRVTVVHRAAADPASEIVAVAFTCEGVADIAALRALAPRCPAQ